MKYHIMSLGCPKNKVDSERFAWVMNSAGWKYSDEPESSDLIILNTCAFIAPATEESLEYLSDIIRWKGEKPGRKIVMTGCLPGRYADDGSGGLEDIDLVTGPGDWRKLSAWLGVVPEGQAQVSGQGSYRYLKIADGCSNACAYCTIPAIRGRFIPRHLDLILRESDLLIQQGACEIGLVAQDSGNWHQNGADLSALTEILAARHPSIWWRLYYLHPLHFPYRLTEIFSKYSNVVPYIDMPIQHASDSILERMGRRHGVGTIETIMEQLDNSPVEIAVRYTVITGYPGETEADFTALRDFLGRYRSGRHIAAFSWYPEEGTLEYSRTIARGDAVDDSTASRRLAAISAVGDALYADWDERLYGRELTILADDRLTGHTRWDAPEVDAVVSFTEPVNPGSAVRAKVVESSGAVLVAEPVN
ncbi:MAG: radical SAM protein [Candidatus Sabulitectum sp.]|nr:radical SAM protein [Candidatus Sabulitectum sp.]